MGSWVQECHGLVEGTEQVGRGEKTCEPLPIRKKGGAQNLRISRQENTGKAKGEETGTLQRDATNGPIEKRGDKAVFGPKTRRKGEKVSS